MARWRPALRIARRSVRRGGWRSLLIAVIVAVPVAGVTMADIAARSYTSPERSLDRIYGTGDAIVSITDQPRITQPGRDAGIDAQFGYVDGAPVNESTTPDAPRRDPRDVDLAAALPDGTVVARQENESDYEPLVVRTGRLTVGATMRVVEVGTPLSSQLARLDSGRAAHDADELVLTPELADRLHVRVGDDVDAGDDGTHRVVGIAHDPFCRSCENVFVTPAFADRRRGADRSTAAAMQRTRRVVVDLPANTDVAALTDSLAADGMLLTTRAGTPDGNGGIARPSTVEELQFAAIGALGSGLALLEIVLLAGAAFAVGVRRQTRDIGLIGAGGGSPRDVRRVVLAQGLVLGVVGAAAGVVVGVAAMHLGSPGWARISGEDMDHWVTRPLELLLAAAVGVFAGFAAAFVPAVGAARTRIVDALAGRMGSARRTRGRAPLAGSALLVVGVVMALVGQHALADQFDQYRDQLAQAVADGTYIESPSSTGAVLAIVVGAALVAASIVLLLPLVIQGIGRFGSRLSLAPRLAVRDAARNRHRTGPAGSAIAIAVAGTVVLAYVVAGTNAADRARYVDQLPENTVRISAYDRATGRQATDLATRSDVARVISTIDARASTQLERMVWPLDGDVAADTAGPIGADPFEEAYVEPVTGCDDGCASLDIGIVRSSRDLDVAAGMRLTDAQRAAFAAGSALVFRDSHLERRDGDRGTVRVSAPSSTDADDDVRLGTPVPAVYVERPLLQSLPQVLLSASTARELGADVVAGDVLAVAKGDAFDRGKLDRAARIAERSDVSVQSEQGPPELDQRFFYVIESIAALVTLIGVAITVTLSAAEGRADLATFAAVGAPPRSRRRMVAAQAVVIAVIGAIAGVLFGSFFAYAARAATGAPAFTVPWANLGFTLVGVPVLALLVAALATPSRFPIVRRVDD